MGIGAGRCASRPWCRWSGSLWWWMRQGRSAVGRSVTTDGLRLGVMPTVAYSCTNVGVGSRAEERGDCLAPGLSHPTSLIKQ